MITQLDVDEVSKQITYRVKDFYDVGLLGAKIENDILWQYIMEQKDLNGLNKAKIVCATCILPSLRSSAIPTKSMIDLVEHMSDDLLYGFLYSVVWDAQRARRKFMRS